MRRRATLEVHNCSFVPVQLPIDHFGNYQGTFQNRYWYNADYYERDGPVFGT